MNGNNELMNAVRGSLVGGAIGDALGYAVEFMREDEIFDTYGDAGITAYDYRFKNDVAAFSDDTQMTLFTAEGLLNSRADGSSLPRKHIAYAYQSWLMTQFSRYDAVREVFKDRKSRLLQEKQLFARRAPGHTCITALQDATFTQFEPDDYDYIAAHKNDSKGCGGVMRVAPIALDPVLRSKMTIEELDMEAAQAAAITHGHPLGYMPAAMQCHIISRIVFPDGQRKPLEEIVLEARDAIAKLFAGDEYLDELIEIVDSAIALSKDSRNDLDNIHWLGEGWVAEETLAIAIYCALRYQDDFSKGMIAAVNHNGDSDSTGAVAGNILGAWIGYEAIEEKWKTNLELRDLILQTADSLSEK